MQLLCFRDRVSPSISLNLCFGTLRSMISVSFPGTHTEIDDLSSLQLVRSNVIPWPISVPSILICASGRERCLLQELSSLVWTAEGDRETACSWCPSGCPSPLFAGLLLPPGKHLQWSSLSVTTSPPAPAVPLTSCAVPFATFGESLVTVKGAIWSKDGKKARRPTCSGLLDPGFLCFGFFFLTFYFILAYS